jgi:hypothetical protein
VRDIIIQRQSTQFLLPEGHSVRVDAGNSTITLHTGGGGGTYELIDARVTPDEVVYVVGAECASSSVGTQPTGYPFVPIHNEKARLRREWVAAGGDSTVFDVYANGDTHNAFFARRRAELREMRSSG